MESQELADEPLERALKAAIIEYLKTADKAITTPEVLSPPLSAISLRSKVREVREAMTLQLGVDMREKKHVFAPSNCSTLLLNLSFALPIPVCLLII
jgi:hypothetical protein